MNSSGQIFSGENFFDPLKEEKLFSTSTTSPLSIPFWIPSSIVKECSICKLPFTFLRRKHHCRYCGSVVCSSCSTHRAALNVLDQVRICDPCILLVKKEQVDLSPNREDNDGFQKEVEEESIEKKKSKFQKTFGSFSFLSLSTGNDASVKSWMMLIGDLVCEDVPAKAKLRRKLFKGIPNGLRAIVWPHISESLDLLSTNRNVYQELLDHIDNSLYLKEIDADIRRTFPENSLFSAPNGIGQRGLFNVLNCFSMFYKGNVGYCQGMNYIAGILLTQMDEENSFWMLVQLMKKYSLEGFFSNGAPQLNRCLQQFEASMKKELPVLYRHFEEYNVPFQIFASQWFRTLFSYNFPLQLVLRIWDVYLLEGIDFLIWIGLSILDQCEEHLIGLNEMDILKFFNKLPSFLVNELSELLYYQSSL